MKRKLYFSSCLGLNKIDRNYHLADGFFDEPPAGEAPTEPIVDEKIKVGEKEYSQADLQKLVGLGEIGLEAETKYKTRLDRVWPQFQSVINEKKQLEEELTKFRSEKEAAHQKEIDDLAKQTTNQQNGQQTQAPQLTVEQIREIALKQAEELGIGPQAIKKTVMEVIEGQKLINDISSVIDDAVADGLPSTTIDDIIKHMQETGIRNPGKAYKDMFDEEWTKNQVDKLVKIKSERTGLPTVSQSTAGAKVPPQQTNFKKMSDADLQKLINEAVQEKYQQ